MLNPECWMLNAKFRRASPRFWFWVAHASRVSGDGVRAIVNFLSRAESERKLVCQKRLFRRDAETNTRDACATQRTLFGKLPKRTGWQPVLPGIRGGAFYDDIKT